MTQTETEQRLAVAERQLSELRVTVAKLHTLVGVLMYRTAPAAEQIPAAADRPRPGRGEDRPKLRLIPAQDSVSGQEMNEGLRRVRAGRGGAR
ncbi:hypothetical protein ABZ690_17890 [Streptomyces sp. NPDC006967]|uniref:hypothetical protein n=1 Tax=unclassified Streptomyces TaxID=2593676 RepID=UPI00340DEE3E